MRYMNISLIYVHYWSVPLNIIIFFTEMRLDGNKIYLKSCLIQTNGTEMAQKTISLMPAMA